MSSPTPKDVAAADFYHGLLPREDIDPLLVVDGDFLIRKTQKDGSCVLAVTARWTGGLRHFIINLDETGYYLESHHEKTVHELINWHVKNKSPCSESSGVILRKAIDKPEWILHREAITMGQKLGEGAFGEVFVATLTTAHSETATKVAVKTMKAEAAESREVRNKFLKEARMMRKLDHRHVVKIMGMVVDEAPLLLIMEFCPGGSLLSYLRKHRGNNTIEIRTRFCVESALGMSFLEKQGIIHRDIAARNVLLTESLTVKISDFGMSEEKERMNEKLTKLDKVPLKWLAPETMQTKVYSLKTDVWSFGVLLWEIWSEGAEPYPGLTSVQTRAKIIVQSYRMEPPKDTPGHIVKVMQNCWSKEPNDRPSFNRIAELVQKDKRKE